VASSGNAATFVPLGDLSGGTFQSLARDVSADGTVVVGTSTSEAGNRAFRWTLAGGMEDIGPGEANAVSADGSVVVGGTGPSGIGVSEAFRWTAGGGQQLLGDLTGGHRSRANGVSADGSVVVGISATNATLLFPEEDPDGEEPGPLVTWHADSEAFRWTESSGMQALGLLSPDTIYDQFSSFASAVSADGTLIVGGATVSTEDARYAGNSGVYWIGTDGPRVSQFDCCEEIFLGMSPDGSTVTGGTWPGGFGSGFWAKRQPDDSLVLVRQVGGGSRGEGSIFDASLGGEVLVGQTVGFSPTTDSTFVVLGGGSEFYYLEDFITNQLGLDITGWNLSEAKAVSWDGNTIVGTGINPNGQPEAWLLVIPEPAVASLLAAGLAALGGSRRRSRPGRAPRGQTLIRPTPPA
jgi:probable HAF family extracellular repeat protein